ncbi:MAG: hypothetical protein JNL88_03530 [Bacteroidia bacterium]|nr:hypothetical protein [Bacteroidia bacterium]
MQGCLMIVFIVGYFFSHTGNSCAQALPDGLKNWQGTWYSINQSDSIFESWVLLHDDTLSGQSWTKKVRGDSIHTEHILLYAVPEGVIYAPVVNSQHGSKAVYFGMVLQSSNYWMFYNEENDFPKFIIYKRLDENHLQATISNSDDPKDPGSITFDFTRLK